jgi:hypothetical protein
MATGVTLMGMQGYLNTNATSTKLACTYTRILSQLIIKHATLGGKKGQHTPPFPAIRFKNYSE